MDSFAFRFLSGVPILDGALAGVDSAPCRCLIFSMGVSTLVPGDPSASTEMADFFTPVSIVKRGLALAEEHEVGDALEVDDTGDEPGEMWR